MITKRLSVLTFKKQKNSLSGLESFFTFRKDLAVKLKLKTKKMK